MRWTKRAVYGQWGGLKSSMRVRIQPVLPMPCDTEGQWAWCANAAVIAATAPVCGVCGIRPRILTPRY